MKTTPDWVHSRVWIMSSSLVVGRSHLLIACCHVLFPYLIGRKDRNKGSGRGGFFYTGAAVGILALDEAHRADHFEAVFSRRFDGLHGGGPGSAHIVHDHHARAFFTEALDALAGAVLLLGFAHEEAVQGPAGDGDGHDDGVGTHGQSSNGVGFPALLADFIEEDFTDELRATSVERGGAAVDVIVAGAAGGQLKLAEAK